MCPDARCRFLREQLRLLWKILLEGFLAFLGEKAIVPTATRLGPQLYKDSVPWGVGGGRRVYGGVNDDRRRLGVVNTIQYTDDKL